MNKYLVITLLGATVVSTALAVDMGAKIVSEETKPGAVTLLADTSQNRSVHYKNSDEPVRYGTQPTYRNANGSETESQRKASGYWI